MPLTDEDRMRYEQTETAWREDLGARGGLA
jgi:hypothetical protein